ncbi:hypothetical protein GT034_29610 [Streptomyces sp. SID2563]|uniref:hypothetical protein n=1 Tax=Streptomyces sp. SID2563 TaxID=2690255 RepID=UPI00136F02D0|nr:hypothetical protein [Streptomyces sp. SID2563]MYW12470.1 hypothetical protein [Streptomyces sp. SID2563]
MTKDTDPTPRPQAAPTSRPATEDRSAPGASSYLSDDTSARPPRTAPSTPPPAAAPVPLAEKDLGHKDVDKHTETGVTERPHTPDRDSLTHTAHSGTDRLLPAGDQDELAHRLHQAVTDFVESPHRAVEEAESTFDAVVAGLTDALKERRSSLHVSEGDGGDPGARTEELRITLQHYRDLTERLLKV